MSSAGAKALLMKRGKRAKEERAGGRREQPPRAVLIFRTKQGSQGADDESVARAGEQVREIVDGLAKHDIEVEVRVTRSKKRSRREAREAAKAGCALVIAAGGDGTVAAVTRGLEGTAAVLGIVPLGAKRNKIATGLGVPAGIGAAIEYIATESGNAMGPNGWWGGPPKSQRMTRKVVVPAA